MKKERTIILFIVLIVGIGILFYLSHYSQTRITPISYGSDFTTNSDLVTIIEINESQIVNGKIIEVKEGDIIPVNLDIGTYTFKISKIDPSNKKVDILLNDFPGFSMALSEEKKIDINFDNVYEISIVVSSIDFDRADLNFKIIHDNAGVIDVVNTKLENSLDDLQKNYNIQSKILFIIIFVIIIFIVFYMIKSFFMPAIRLKKINARHEPSDALEYLISEFEKIKDDKVKSKKLYERIKHLYSYLTKEEKRRYKKKIRHMERYIN